MHNLIILSSNPLLGSSWEQGLEVALMLADLEQEVAVLFESEFLDYICGDQVGVVCKKLGQLDLLDIKTYAYPYCSLDFVECLNQPNLRAMFKAANSMAVF